MAIHANRCTQCFDGVGFDIAENLSGIGHVHLEYQNLIAAITFLHRVEQRTRLGQSSCKWRQWRGRGRRRRGTKVDEKTRHIRYHMPSYTKPQQIGRDSAYDEN